MRQGGPNNNNRRPRGRHHSGSNGGDRNNGGNISRSIDNNRPRSAASLRHQNFDSNGPDVRVRGNAWQVYEKYQALARDAAGSGDHVTAESLLQHAEHYYRIIEAINEATASEQNQRGPSTQQPNFGAQPEVPANYYTQDGNLAQPQGAPAGNPSAPTPQAQAEVQSMRPAATAPSFFPPDEPEDSANGPASMIARR